MELTKKQQAALSSHAGHEIDITEYPGLCGSQTVPGANGGEGSDFCIECRTCDVVILGDHIIVGSSSAMSVS